VQATHRHTHRYSTLKRTEGWKREEVNGIIFGRAAPWGRLLPSGAESEHLKRLIKKEVKWLEPARLSVVLPSSPRGIRAPPPSPRTVSHTRHPWKTMKNKGKKKETMWNRDDRRDFASSSFPLSFSFIACLTGHYVNHLRNRKAMWQAFPTRRQRREGTSKETRQECRRR